MRFGMQSAVAAVIAGFACVTYVSSAQADILCSVTKGSGKGTIKVQSGAVCPKGQSKLDIAALGLQGPAGPQGATGPAGSPGPAGPAGPAPDLNNVKIEWTAHRGVCLFFRDWAEPNNTALSVADCSHDDAQRFNISR